MPITPTTNDSLDIVNESWVSVVKSVAQTQVLVSVSGSNLLKRQLLRVKNVSSNDIYVGPNGVATSGANQGERVMPDESIEMMVGDNIDVYAISATGTNDVLIWEFS